LFRAAPASMRIMLSDDLESLKERVIGRAITVHQFLGPGLLESMYQDCMVIELGVAGLTVERERRVYFEYRGQPVGAPLKVDLVVDNRLIVEVKAVERLHPVHLAQVITYLKLTGFPTGLLMNFNATSLRAGLRTAVHPDLYNPPQGFG
jgi:GxxExxY protein